MKIRSREIENPDFNEVDVLSLNRRGDTILPLPA